MSVWAKRVNGRQQEKSRERRATDYRIKKIEKLNEKEDNTALLIRSTEDTSRLYPRVHVKGEWKKGGEGRITLAKETDKLNI
eukprot:gene9814-6890_t